jgi:hypothetical protein
MHNINIPKWSACAMYRYIKGIHLSGSILEELAVEPLLLVEDQRVPVGRLSKFLLCCRYHLFLYIFTDHKKQ